MKTICIPYAPRAHQLRLHNAMAMRSPGGVRRYRWAVLVWHRRAGKTWAAVAELIRAALEKPGSRLAMVGPTFSQMKDIAWDALKKLCAPVPGMSFSETELRADFPNDSRIRLYGAENPDRMRGLSLDGVVLDEPAQHPASMFSAILRPALSDRKGWGIWIGTPNGKDHFYQVYTSAKATNGSWYASTLKASKSKVLDREELASALADMIAQSGEAEGRSLYEQEYECNFEAPVVGSYFGEALRIAEDEGRVVRGLWEPGKPVDVAMDIGIGDAFWLLWGQRVGKEKRIIDAYGASGEGYQHYANVIREKPYTYRRFYLPHDGGNQQLGDAQGRTLREIFEGYGVRPCEVLERGDVDPGINAARVLLRSAWIDAEKCEGAIAAWKAYRKQWDEKNRVWKSRPKHDWASHPADALRCLAQAWGVYGGVVERERVEEDEWSRRVSRPTILNAYGQPANGWMA